SFSLAVPLLPGREFSVDAYSFLKSLSKASGMNLEDHGLGDSLLHRRAELIAASKRGTVYAADGSEGKPASSLANGEALWQACAEGGTWVDDAADAVANPVFSLLGQLTDAELARSARMQQAAGSLTLVPFSTRAAVSGATISPVMSKIFQECDLRMNGGTLLLNPKTALLFGLKNEDRASVRTKNGRLTARVLWDPSVRPGLLYAAVGPLPNGTPVADEEQGGGVLSLCTIQDDGSWRFTEATIEKV
ncbi:MAG TPA: molybdopterin dinucleotide binding domain-containing protein, partial [Bacteroidota bacterium]|nr:molybdopterin dinucleotide binding domain-containing protein [Bacteroidota bacterium]